MECFRQRKPIPVKGQRCTTGWSDDKIMAKAQEEPERLEFWKQYYPNDYLGACRAVVENPSSFDAIFEKTFPEPERYISLRREQ